MRGTADKVLQHVWYGDGAVAAAARLALMPATAAYAAIVGARNALYDSGIVRTCEPAIPVIAVGNLTVGGTGKTPVTAWIASELESRGTRPAVVLRKYGADEPLIHRILNPTVPVVVESDRVAAVRRAAQEGASVAVLDDAFQHRRLRRSVDIVLVSADRWSNRAQLLPAGPYREPTSAARRADVIIVTVRAAGIEKALEAARWLRGLHEHVPVAVARLEPVALIQVPAGQMAPLSQLRGARIMVIAGIADPQSFRRQLSDLGADIVRSRFPGDHHDYGSEEAIALSRDAEGCTMAVCTLKDAVKLDKTWPRGAVPLWYVSQRLVMENGRDHVDAALDGVIKLTRTDTNAG